ncbi:MAG: PHP-associated domain-containing protein [Firmicutes bacterium]|nr:PHP-associated domain-containing protein [Bacillota bacterium]
MYKYETHLHTSPVSKCAQASVGETLAFYKSCGYDGVFITNHFLDGNINTDSSLPYEQKIEFYFSDYEKGVKIGNEIGLKVFFGIESSYKGTDFLVYGLDKKWFLKNPQIMQMKKSDELNFFRENGALVIQAHPYRQADYIDHIRLFPECIDGVEVINANRAELENKMALMFADEYGLLKTAGSDNHIGSNQIHLAGMSAEEPFSNEEDFIAAVKSRQAKTFSFYR